MIITINGKEYSSKVLEKIRGNWEVKLELLRQLWNKESSLKDLANSLGKSRQEVYYHLRELVGMGLVEKKGKKYKTSIDLILIPIRRLSFSKGKSPDLSVALRPIVEGEKLNAYIVVGAPYPHGPLKAIARDLHYSSILAFHLAKIVANYKDELVKLDVDVVREGLLGENLILIGGPVVNSVTLRVNSNLKVRFLKEDAWAIYSTQTKNKYYGEFTGLVAKVKNPFNEDSKLLILAGIKAIGTKVAIKFLMEGEVCKNCEEFYYVVEGFDLDGDGRVDDIQVLESLER